MCLLYGVKTLTVEARCEMWDIFFNEEQKLKRVTVSVFLTSKRYWVPRMI